MKKFDVIVIGSGAGGLVLAIGNAKIRKKVLLIEKGEFGGDCTNTGCIPSKTLISIANRQKEWERLAKYRNSDERISLDGTKIMDHVRAVVDSVRKEEDQKALEKIGIVVEKGTASFISENRISIAHADGSNTEVEAKKIIIATGASPLIPDIKGLSTTPYHTNETIFNLKDIPETMAIIGAGPIGCELAQAFSRLGCKITLIHRGNTLLKKEEEVVSDLIQKTFEKEGIELRLSCEVDSASFDNGKFDLKLKGGGEVKADQLLVAIGRTPNTKDLNLNKAKISLNVDKYCRTEKHHIFAVGDAIGPHYFTHLAEHHARGVLRNLILGKMFYKSCMPVHLPKVTFTQPEVASVGLSYEQAKKKWRFVKTYDMPYSKIDRAITNAPDEGFIKIVTKRWSSQIVGVTIVGDRAGEMLMEPLLAMHKKIPLRFLAKVIHPYPTYSRGFRKIADRYLTDVFLSMFRRK